MESEKIKMLMRQTTYTEEEAKDCLERNKTVEACIKEYLGVSVKPEEKISVNQGIFKALREFIDN
jgi:hypothetical protein